MENDKLTRELEDLRENLAALWAEVKEAETTSVGLEEQLQQAKERLDSARSTIEDHEALLAEKETLLRRAQREEALQRRDAAAARLAEAISRLLAELEGLEAAEESVAAVEGRPARLRDEHDVLAEPWEQLKEAVRQRSDIEFADELVEAAAQSRTPEAMNALPAHLREAARVRVQVRKRERLAERDRAQP